MKSMILDADDAAHNIGTGGDAAQPQHAAVFQP